MRRLSLSLGVAVCLVACGKATPSGPRPASSVTVPAAGGVVPITADEKGFTPTEVYAPKGAPLTLLFTRTSDNTCADEVVFPELKIRRPLPLHETVAVALPTEVAHTYKFQCGMAMWQGNIVVK